MVSASHEAYRLLPFLRQRFPQLTILDYVHFVTPNWMDGGFPRLSVLFNSALDLSVVTSQQVRQWMTARGADQSRIEVCTVNVDTDLWQPDPDNRARVRAELGINDELSLILYIGRIEQQKQPAVFAGTVKRLAAQGLPFLALVIGEGTLKPWLEEFVNHEALAGQVRFTGGVPSNRVRELMAAADIVFLPSENEGIAMTFYEGMASGLVPVGADVGGQTELVTPQCGYLLARSTPEDEAKRYACVLADLIRNPEQRRQMGQASRRRVIEHFRLDQMGERMQSLIYLAQRLRQEKPRAPQAGELAELLARQSTEYLRTLAAYQQKKQEAENPGMPPASARTYFYFALRQLLLPLLGPHKGKRWIGKLKTWIKGGTASG